MAPGWGYGGEPAVDAALIGRYYERFVDHAVALAGQVCYLVTGDYPSPVTRSAASGLDRSAVMRHSRTEPRSPVVASHEVIEADGVLLHVARRRAHVDGHAVHLPARETAALSVLMTRAGQVIYRNALADAAGIAHQGYSPAPRRLPGCTESVTPATCSARAPNRAPAQVDHHQRAKPSPI